MCELYTMEIAALRKELSLSLDGFAAAIGLKSRGQVHEIETGTRTPSVPVALEIERLSKGRIPADILNKDVALVRAFKREAANDTSDRSEAA